MRPFRTVALLLYFCGCLNAAQARPFVIGSISHSPGQEIQLFHTLADYLSRRLPEFGFDSGKVLVAQDIAALSERFNAGMVDLYMDGPFPSLAVNRAAGTQIILRRWKKGTADYGSVVVVRRDSAMSTLAELKGRKVAFESNFSTTGYFLPLIALDEAGLTVREHRAVTSVVPPGEVGYLFTHDHENTLLWVLRGRIAAGAASTQDLARLTPQEREQLRIIHQTANMPRQLVSVRKDAPPSLVARISALLIGLEHTEEGRRLLAHLENTTRFDPLTEELNWALQPIRSYLARTGGSGTR